MALVEKQEKAKPYTEQEIKQIIIKVKQYVAEESYLLASNTIYLDSNFRQIQQYYIKLQSSNTLN